MGDPESRRAQLDTPRRRKEPIERERERMMQARSVSRATTVCSARPRTVKVSAVSRPNRLSEAKAVLKKELPKIEAAAIVGAATLTASPALALVDKRMNGDGTRLFLGINDPILGFILVSVFGAVWAVFSQSTKELGAGEEDGDDGGLSL